MQTITLFVYRRFLLPIGTASADVFSDRPGHDPYFTNGADYVREAMWLVVSQRPDILCFYYAGRLPPDNPTLDPFKSSPETFDAVGEVCRTLLEPHGPVILQCERYKPRVAVLLSATAVWFHHEPLWYGYPNEQTLPYCILLMINHIPFDVLLDDDIRTGALEGYGVLVIPRGDTLTESVHGQIVRFANNGGRVITHTTLRGKVPGAIINDFDFSFEFPLDGRYLAEGKAITADEYRECMEKYADELDRLLRDVPRPADSTTKRFLINTLETGGLRYIFLINDERTYGTKFGKWKLVYETGLRQTATVRVPIKRGQILYNTIGRKEIKAELKGGKAQFRISLPPAGGRLIAVLPERIGDLQLRLPPRCLVGKRYSIEVRVMGKSGRPIEGSIAAGINILDPMHCLNEYSRYASTTLQDDGVDAYILNFTPAVNDLVGEWSVRVTELISGVWRSASFTVSRSPQ